MSFGARLRDARKSAGLTQAQLGEILGVSDSTVTSWEKETRQPDITNIKRLTQALNVSAEFLLEIENAPTPAATGTGAEDEVDELELDELVGLIHGWLVESGQLKEGEDIDPLRAKLLVAIIKAIFE